MTISARPSRIGSNKARDLVTGILVVGVGIDDDVGPQLQRRVDARGEGARQSLVGSEPDDVLNAQLPGNAARLVRRAVIDDQHFYLIYTGDALRHPGERHRQSALPR